MSESGSLLNGAALPPTLTGLLALAGLVFLASYVFRPINNVVKMASLWSRGVLFFLFNSDQRYKSPHQDPELILLPSYQGPVEEVIVSFVRHGESSWNEVFNRGFGFSFLSRFFNAAMLECIYAFFGDSVFIDAPLSPVGFQQALALQQFVREAPSDAETDAHSTPLTPVQRNIYRATVAALRGRGVSAPSPVYSVSNLRRAVATVAVGLSPTLSHVDSPVVHCLSSLQEIARNVDTMSLLPPRQRPTLMLAGTSRTGTPPHLLPPPPPGALAASSGGNSSDLAHETLAGADAALSAFVWSGNGGNKTFFGKGLARLRTFAGFATQTARPPSEAPSVVVACGHSLYFREFFKVFLPRASVHVAKKKKMQNAGVVSFVLRKGRVAGEDVYAIVPSTVTSVYLGFCP